MFGFCASSIQILIHQYCGSHSSLIALGEHVLASLLFKLLIYHRKTSLAMLTKICFGIRLYLSKKLLISIKWNNQTARACCFALIYMVAITYLLTLNQEVYKRLKQRVSRRFNSHTMAFAFFSKALVLSSMYNFIDRVALLNILDAFVPRGVGTALQGFFWFKLLESKRNVRIIYPSAVLFSAFFASVSLLDYLQGGSIPSLIIIAWSTVLF